MCSLQVNYVSVEKVGEPNKPPTQLHFIVKLLKALICFAKMSLAFMSSIN